MKKILVFGDTGKVGYAVKNTLENNYFVKGYNGTDLDATNLNQIKDIVASEDPDVVINCIGFVGIDKCEQRPRRAYMLNANVPTQFGVLSNKYDFLLINFSSDAVFGCDKNASYIESDKPYPVSVYGATKKSGDEGLEMMGKRYYNLRLSLVFGQSPKQNYFVDNMIAKMKNGESITVADDLYRSPTYNYDIAMFVETLLDEKLKHGLYHVANEGIVSLYQLVAMINKLLGLDATVERGSYMDFPNADKKHVYTPLKSEKIDNLRDWKQAIKNYCDMIKE